MNIKQFGLLAAELILGISLILGFSSGSLVNNAILVVVLVIIGVKINNNLLPKLGGLQ
jgi:hypothetical protein